MTGTIFTQINIVKGTNNCYIKLKKRLLSFLLKENVPASLICACCPGQWITHINEACSCVLVDIKMCCVLILSEVKISFKI